MNCPIEDLNFTVRIYNCLKRAGIDTKEQLENLTKKDLLKVRNLGKGNIKEIMKRKDINLKKKETII